jgi:hypothetical protein
MSIECRNNKMNSRVKTLFGLVVLGLSMQVLWPSMTRADELSWGQLKTPKIEIEVFSSGQGQVLSSYPAVLQKLLTRVLAWDPRKELNISTSTPALFPPNPSIHEEQKVSLTELLRNLSVEFDVQIRSTLEKFGFI